MLLIWVNYNEVLGPGSSRQTWVPEGIERGHGDWFGQVDFGALVAFS
jgi:hypothetical protein